MRMINLRKMSMVHHCQSARACLVLHGLTLGLHPQILSTPAVLAIADPCRPARPPEWGCSASRLIASGAQTWL